jgi:putative ABC transport system permease protein
VLERTKEIGILRALGASKSNISQLFNAETFIIGLISGGLGIIVSQLLIIPLNIIIQNMLGAGTVTAQLPVTNAFLLILLSVMITIIGGLFPARKATKRDLVIALRTE